MTMHDYVSTCMTVLARASGVAAVNVQAWQLTAGNDVVATIFIILPPPSHGQSFDKLASKGRIIGFF